MSSKLNMWFTRSFKLCRKDQRTKSLSRLQLGTWEADQPLASSSASLRSAVPRRRSLPAIHLQEQQQDEAFSSTSIMSNPPVFHNPLRRRGCCNHMYAEQLTGYRKEAIQRELDLLKTTGAAVASSPPIFQ